MKIFVGIDDTDTRETRGTGYHARQLAARIEEKGIGTVFGITRHQNFVHPDIAYTSQNSSACLLADAGDMKQLGNFCRAFLLEIAPEGSDVGLCMIPEEKVPKVVEEWGKKAKCEVLTKSAACKLAAEYNIFLEGLTGNHDGIIGALAATGLRKNGNDGRFIWLKGQKELRDVSAGLYSPEWLKFHFGVSRFLTKTGEAFVPEENILIHEWFRPVLTNNQVTLILEKKYDHGKKYWKFADKDFIRAHS